MNKFEQELLDAGYKPYKDHWKNALNLYAKKITDEKGIRYHIHCYHYNFSKQFPEQILDDYDSYQFEVQFRKDKNGKDNTMDISFNGSFTEYNDRILTSLVEVEEFYDKFWRTFKPDYYEIY